MSIRSSIRIASALMLAITGALMSPLTARAAAGPDPKMFEPKTAAPMATAANAFGTQLYSQLAAKPGNVFFSPFSISAALTLTQRGARDTTATEMATVLHLPDDKLVNDANEALFVQLQYEVDKKPYQLSVANALWLQNNTPFNIDFLTTAHDSYRAGAEALDFIKASDASRQIINDWVAKQTNDKIKDLLPAGSITPDTRLVLTNAVYFKGTWSNQFNKNATKDGDFTTLDGKKTTASLMHIKEHYNIIQGWNDAAVLELPYKGGDLAMMVLLPNKNDAASLAAVEAQIKPDTFATLQSKLEHQEVTVTLPKWKMTQRYSLKPTLQSMGMKLAFAGANFSGINGRTDLEISDVVHQAFIEVNEEGTEAAGATGVVMRAAAAMPAPRQPILFTADHPFLYAIIHKPTNTILFMGRIEDPK